VRAVVVGTTGVNMRALAAFLDSFHKEQVRVELGLYFV